MLNVDAQPIDGNLVIDAQNQYGNHADYLDVNAVIQHGKIAVDAYEKPAGLQCYIPLFNTISPWWSELALDAGSHVRASVATRQVPDTLVVETLANNLPRFEKRGNLFTLLDEPGPATNLIHFSHELGNVASGGWWTDTRLTSVIANGMLAPDGNVVADGLIADANDDTHQIYSSLIAGIAQNDKVALTVFAKPGNKNWAYVRVNFYDVGDVPLNDGGAYYFDVDSGTLGTKIESGSATVHDYKIEEAANGFYRVGIIISNNDVNTVKIRAFLFSADDNNDRVFPGDTTTVNTWFWGADFKKQAYFDSYVATSGATASRATESGYPLYTLPLGLFDAQGTCSVWVRFGYDWDVPPINTNSGLVSCQDHEDSVLRNSRGGGIGITYIYTLDGTTPCLVALPWIAHTWYKLVAKWSSTTSKMRVGYDSGAGIAWGTEVAFDGSYTLGAALRLAYGLYGPMWFHKLMIFDRTATDIEINAHHGSP